MSAPRFHRQHPIAMLRYTYRYLFLLLLPLGRGLLYVRTPAGLYHWLRGTWLDLTVVLLLLLLPLAEWYRHTYAVTSYGFLIRRGLPLWRETTLPRHSITTLTVERPWYLRILGAVRIAIDTDAGSPYRADHRLIIKAAQAAAILAQRQAAATRAVYTYRPPRSHVVVFSILASNSLSGVLLLATTLYQTGRILGEGVQDTLLNNVEAIAGLLTVIPRTAAVIALTVLAGWGAGVVRNLLRYLPFRVTRTENALHIRTGAPVRRDHLCAVSAVNYVDHRQSLMSRLLRLHTVFVNCVGYGKEKNAMAVLLPACPRDAALYAVERLLPAYRQQPVSLRPRRWAILRYLRTPLLVAALLLPVSRLLQGLLPNWQELLYYLTFIAYVPCAGALAVGLLAFFTTGMAVKDGYYTLRYARHFTFHTVVVPPDKVVTRLLRQNPLQRLTGSCDVLVYTHNERRLHHRIKSVPLSQAAALLAGKE